MKEFGGYVANEKGRGEGVVEPFVKMASEALSMPMTILWGLQTLYDDDAWTKKDTLEIHVSSLITFEGIAC